MHSSHDPEEWMGGVWHCLNLPFSWISHFEWFCDAFVVFYIYRVTHPFYDNIQPTMTCSSMNLHMNVCTIIISYYSDYCRLYVGSRVACGPPYLIMVLWKKGSEVCIYVYWDTWLYIYLNLCIIQLNTLPPLLLLILVLQLGSSTLSLSRTIKVHNIMSTNAHTYTITPVLYICNDMIEV